MLVIIKRIISSSYKGKENKRRIKICLKIFVNGNWTKLARFKDIQKVKDHVFREKSKYFKILGPK